MDPWEKEHIISNLYDLVLNTSCTTQLFAALQSAKILSQVDKETIEAEKTNHEKSYKLYEIVPTRTNGFLALMKALYETNQTGAANILQLRFSFDLIRNKPVTFLGKEETLYQLLKGEFSHPTSSFLATLTTVEYFEFLETVKEPLDLVRNTIPPKDRFYIPRVLIKRIGIDPTVFKVDAPDVFVFQADNLRKLQTNVDEPIRNSSDQLRKITAKFILLKIEDDWERLKSIAIFPIHLVKYNIQDNTFILLETSGGSTILHNFLFNADGSTEGRIAENAILEKMEADGVKGICISDLPGSGKSLLLENLARMATEKFSDQLSCCIYLPALAATILQETENGKTKISPCKILAKFLTQTPFAAAVLKQVLEFQDTCLNLFFDALDEVPAARLEAVSTFLQELSTSFLKVTIFVSSRTHLRVQLEKTLGVLAFDIESFSDKTQLEFITNFWTDSLSNCSISKLEHFATQALATINEQLTDKERSIAGVPLHCKLIAEVLSDDAELYAHPNRNMDIDKNLFKNVLYPKYINLKLGQSSCKLRCIFKMNVGQTRLCPVSCHVFNFHLIYALSEILPNFVSKIWKHLNVPELDENIVWSRGILVKVQETQIQKFKFVHRTFAEYLVAYFVENTFTNEFWNRNISKGLRISFYRTVFMEQEIYSNVSYHGNSVVVYFLNSLITETQTYEKIQSIGKTCAIPNDPQHFFQLVVSFIKNKYTGLLQLMMVLASRLTTWTKASNQVFIDKARLDLIGTLVLHFEWSVAKILFESMKNLFDIDLDNACVSNNSNGDSPLCIAIGKQDVDAVRFFLNKPLQNSRLLYKCAENTHAMDSKELEKRLEIVNIVVEKYPNLPALAENSPVLMENVHPEIFKRLVQSGAQLVVNNSFFVNKVLKYMDKTEFLELSHFLISKCNATHLYLADLNKHTVPLVDITLTGAFGIEVAIQILQFLDEISVNGVLQSGSTVCKEAKLLWDIAKIKEFYCNEALNIATTWNFKLYSEILCICNANLPNGNYFKGLFFSGIERDEDITNDILFVTLKNSLARTVNVFERDPHGNSILHNLTQLQNKIEFNIAMTFLLNNWKNLVRQRYPHPSVLTLRNLRSRFFESTNIYGDIPLHYAVRYVNLETDELDRFLMGWLITNWNPEYVVMNINHVNIHGETPLHFAIRGQMPLSFLKHMIYRGAGIQIKKEHGDSLAHFCASEFTSSSSSLTIYLLNTIENLLDLGIPVNGVNNDGNNVLQYVLLNADRNNVRSVLENRIIEFAKACKIFGVNLQHVNKEKYTAHDIAHTLNYNTDLMKILDVSNL